MPPATFSTSQTDTRTPLEKWQDGIRLAPKDPKWSRWDCEIQSAIRVFNEHLRGTPGYTALDWQLIKAMAWVETGATSPEWAIKPMQIGVAGDPGLDALLAADGGGSLILPPAFTGNLTAGSVRSQPTQNIRAGIGYLLLRMAEFTWRNTHEPGAPIREVMVKVGDNPSKIAAAEGTTVEDLRALNPSLGVLHPGQKLKLRRATIQQVITGWRSFQTTTVARRYNGGGDPTYAQKLDFALSIIRQGATVTCAS